jgi:alpha-D-xyloside xylohydrolase
MRPEPLTIEIYRGADLSFTLYVDDGETSAYQSGAWAETPIEVTEGAQVFTCRVGETRGDFGPAKSERTVVMNIHRQPPVRAVNCDRDQLDALPDAGSI